MLASVAAVALAAAPQLKVAVVDVAGVGFAPDAKNFYTQQLAIELGQAGVEATTPQQIAAVLGLERNKQLLGCGEESTACLIELGNALGVDGIVMTDLAKIGSVFQLSIRVINGGTGQAVATFSKRVDREEDLLGALGEGARNLAQTASAALGRSLKATASSTSGGEVRRASWIPAVGGLVLVGGGAISLIAARANHDALTLDSGYLDLARAQQIRNEGQAFQTLGYIGLSVGGAALLAAGAMAIFGGPTQGAPQVSVAPVQGGAALMFGGGLP